MSVADKNQKDTDLMYSLLTEGKLDLMYLPSGAIAWLWDRPEAQVHAARDLAVAAKDICPVTDAALLRSDQNVLVLHCEDGHKFNVYPDGGYGCDGQPLDVQGCMQMLDQGMMQDTEVVLPPEDCPMEGGGAPQPGEEFMTPDSLAAGTADAVVTMEGKRLEADSPDFVANAAKIIARHPDHFLKEFKNLMDLKGAFIVSSDDFKPENVERREKIGRAFGKAIYDGEYEQAARIWQDYALSVGPQEDVLMAGQMDEGKFSFDISLKDMHYHELVNWFRKMRKQLSPEQHKGIKQLLNKKRAEEMEAWSPGAFTGQEREWQPTTEEEGDEDSIFDKDREDKLVDLICQTRSIGELPDFMQTEAEGSQGDAGPVSDVVFDFEDELAQLGAFVGEELKKHRD